jgi:hypothetical protein
MAWAVSITVGIDGLFQQFEVIDPHDSCGEVTKTRYSLTFIVFNQLGL